jgi:phosphate starvation-inducible protein PhoH and related proteins
LQTAPFLHLPPLPSPRTPLQRAYLDLLLLAGQPEAAPETAPKPSILLATGPAGCGKTLFAAAAGAHHLAAGRVRTLVVTRPVASADEPLGFLPGDLDAKLAPWMRPVLDALGGPARCQALLRSGALELAPLGLMRGRTFAHAWVILDEAQNTTPNQMLLFLTRIGQGSTLVVTGDLAQHDRSYAHANGLRDLLARLDRARGRPGPGPGPHPGTHYRHVAFDAADVQRHPSIAVTLALYADDDAAADAAAA